MHFTNAIPSVGRPAYLIKENKIVGLVHVQGIDGRCGIAKVTMTDAAARTLVQDHPTITAWLEVQPDKVWDYALFQFHQTTGDYADLEKDTEGKPTVLTGTQIVDKQNFDWGIVSDTFAQVEEYGARRQHNCETQGTPMKFSITPKDLANATATGATTQQEAAVKLVHEYVDTELKDAVEELRTGNNGSGKIRIVIPNSISRNSSKHAFAVEEVATHLRKAGFAATFHHTEASEDGSRYSPEVFAIEIKL